MGRNGIGLCDFTTVAGFPAFGIVTTIATFQSDSTWSNLNEVLKSCVSFKIVLFGRSGFNL